MDSTIARTGAHRVAATVAIVLLLSGLAGLGALLGGVPSPASAGSHLSGPNAPSSAPIRISPTSGLHVSTVRPAPAVAKITLTPASAQVGDAVVANGTGFLPSNASSSNAVTVTWAPGGWVLCNVATNATGAFVCGFTVPEGVGGAHAVKATDTVPNAATATLTVKSLVTLSPTEGLAGSPAAVSVTGFAGNSNTSFIWAPTSSQLCKQNTSAFGSLKCAFAVPAAASLGTHVITVTDTASDSGTVTFTVAAVPPTVSVVLTNSFHLYMPTPLNLTWSISSSSPVNTETTQMWLLVQDLGSSACPYIIFNGLGIGVAVQNTPCTVLNYSLNSLLVNGTDTYSFSLTDGALTSQNYHGGILPFATEYTIGVFVSVSTSPYVNGTTSGSVGTGGANQNVYLQTYLPTGTLVSPNPNAGISTGNTSVVVSYSGDFVSGAEINIYAASTQQLVYSAGVAVAGPGSHIGTAAAAWRPTVPGAYTAVLNLSGPYGYSLTSFALQVVPAGTTVYVNSSSYHNDSLLKGYSASETATLLLVVGLIIGMVVALLLGKMVWGGSASKPPTPWASKPGEGGTNGKSAMKPNECPTCHQQFGSAAELADHQKKAHGSSS